MKPTKIQVKLNLKQMAKCHMNKNYRNGFTMRHYCQTKKINFIKNQIKLSGQLSNETMIDNIDSIKNLIRNIVDENSPDYLEDVDDFNQLIKNIRLLSNELHNSDDIQDELDILLGNEILDDRTEIDVNILVSILLMRELNKQIQINSIKINNID